jgi:pyruvate formate lyase activating enzyme
MRLSSTTAANPKSVSSAIIARIERSAIHDGPGIRTVVFLKGCPLRCAWCHSPETQEAAPQLAWYEERCIRCHTCFGVCPDDAISARNGSIRVDRERCTVCGDCTTVCPVIAREVIGRPSDVDDVMRAIERDRVFYEHSGGGVTLSGGEPLQQPAFAEELLRRCRQRYIPTAVETCGLANRKTLLAVATYTDLFLYDLKVIDDARHRVLTGMSNRGILDNLRALVACGRRVRVRFPLVPGLNDDDDNVAAVGACAAALRIDQIDVLPYHRAGLAKYRRLDRRPPELPVTSQVRARPDSRSAEDLEPPDESRVQAVLAILRRYGLDVRTGGSR